MRPTQARHILIFVALLHLLSDAALAGSLVFCVGPNDHRALEVEHLGVAGCESSAAETDGVASLTPSPGDCADSPLHPEADIAVGTQDWGRASALLSGLPSPFASASILGRSELHARVRAPDIARDLLAQGTTVLLL